MKKIHISSMVRRPVFYGLILVVAGLGWGVWYWVRHAGVEVGGLYRSYVEASHVHEQAAFLPGDAQNPTRAELNFVLTRMLASGATPEQRLAFAKQGLELIDALNAQVDVIGETAPEMDAAVSALESEARHIGYVPHRTVLLDIAKRARHEMNTIEDIRGLSYLANFETKQVFERLLADHGVLTKEYLVELNNQLPKVEEEFSRRTNLYYTLEGDMSHISQDAEDLGVVIHW